MSKKPGRFGLEVLNAFLKIPTDFNNSPLEANLIVRRIGSEYSASIGNAK